MKKEYREDLKKRIKNYFKDHETWNTPNFSFRDHDLQMHLFDYETPVTKNNVYTVVRGLSIKAEDGIADRMSRLGQDFYFAKDYMKYKHILPLLIKRRGIGWYEPTFDDLDDDQKKRFEHHKKSMKFSKRRTERLEEMKEIQEKLNEVTKK